MTICRATRGLTDLGNPSSHWKERAIPPMIDLGGRISITWSYVNLYRREWQGSTLAPGFTIGLAGHSLDQVFNADLGPGLAITHYRNRKTRP